MIFTTAALLLFFLNITATTTVYNIKDLTGLAIVGRY